MPRTQPAIAIADHRLFEFDALLMLCRAAHSRGDKLSFAKGLVVRRDPDREATGRILRDALVKLTD